MASAASDYKSAYADESEARTVGSLIHVPQAPGIEKSLSSRD